ncbi:ATP-binding protein [Streptomyces sp. NPDC046751]|uniref:ATP-binding protein n=1 Tax=Streptomyces sp. NPDC046751 TaxID=3160977 RepID=UPI0034045F41
MSGRTHIKRFRARRDSVPAARRHVESVLTEWKLGGLIDETTLLASELSTNAVIHAKGTGDYFELALRRRGGTLALEVSDSYQWRMPELRTPTPDDLSGRGLVIVDAVIRLRAGEPYAYTARAGGRVVDWYARPVRALPVATVTAIPCRGNPRCGTGRTR